MPPWFGCEKNFTTESTEYTEKGNKIIVLRAKTTWLIGRGYLKSFFVFFRIFRVFRGEMIGNSSRLIA